MKCCHDVCIRDRVKGSKYCDQCIQLLTKECNYCRKEEDTKKNKIEWADVGDTVAHIAGLVICFGAILMLTFLFVNNFERAFTLYPSLNQTINGTAYSCSSTSPITYIPDFGFHQAYLVSYLIVFLGALAGMFIIWSFITGAGGWRLI